MTVNIPGPYIVAGQLFFRLCDGSSISCECIAEVYAEEVVKACNSTELAQERDLYRSRWLSCVTPEEKQRQAITILKEERAQLGAHPHHWKIANALDRAINRLEALS